MKILFLSQYYPTDLLNDFNRNTKVGLDFAAHNLNRAIFQGFKDNNLPIDILNIPHLGSFPPYHKSPFVPSYINRDLNIKSLSFINLSFFKRYDIKRKVKYEMYKWCKDNKGDKIIILYNFDLLPLIPKLKEHFHDVKVCMLVTDLKEFMAPTKTMLTRFNSIVTKLFTPENINNYRYLDGYILLAEKMTDRLPIGNRPWMLMEGIYNPEITCEAEKEKNLKIILYTGNLGRRYGLLDLLEAFCQTTDPNLRLWICGTGDSLNEYIERQKIDNRIKYLGVLPRKEVIKLQKQATVLINPRYSKDEYTLYSFPSKTMEYMASGTPVLMSKLKSLPKEYINHLYFFEEESINGFKESIEKLCSKPKKELDDFGAGASSFIMEYKTPQPQVKRIIDFLKTL